MSDTYKPRHLENFNCLVVDSDKFARNFTKTALFQIGLKNIREASSASEAMDIIKSVRVDIIFTDQEMPEKTGLEMIEELSASDADFTEKTPIVMITSDTKETTVLKAKELGVREYIIKPVSPALLKKRIYNILNIEESNSRE